MWRAVALKVVDTEWPRLSVAVMVMVAGPWSLSSSVAWKLRVLGLKLSQPVLLALEE